MKKITLPAGEEVFKELSVGDMVLVSGTIYTGRDAVLPKLAEMISNDTLKDTDIDFNGSLMFHTAVSVAGIGPTSSNKLEIEGTMEDLSKAGIRIHLGKGALKKETVKMLARYNSVYAVIPPVTALLGSKTLSSEVAAFDELGMEALHRLEVTDIPMIIAAAGGHSIYE